MVFWDYARTEQDIRENMYLPLSGLETGLVSYWQFNEGSGITTADNISGNNGTLTNMAEEDWITSTIPFGDGVSDSQTESAGTVDFIDTGLSMYFNYQNGAEITVTRIDTIPNINPTEPYEVFDAQYWIVNRFGSGSFDADLTFTFNEDLIDADESDPANIKLYTRASNADTSWVYLTNASSVNAATDESTFDGITEFSQFIIGRYEQQSLDIPQDVTISIDQDSVHISWDTVSGANSYKIYASDDPYGTFTEDGSGTFTYESWSAPVPNGKMFYYVIASSDTVRDNVPFLSKPSKVISNKIITPRKILLNPKRKNFQKRD